MKKLIALVLTIVIAAGVFSYSVYYKNKKVREANNGVGYEVSSTEAQPISDVSVEYSNDKPVIVTKDKEYEIYFDGEMTTIVHGNIRHKQRNWKYVFEHEVPAYTTVDIDNDGEKELLLKVFSGNVTNVENREVKVYAVFMFDPVKDADGNGRLNVHVASTDTWKIPFEDTVRAEVKQLEGCNKILQFTMADVGKQIEYDKDGFSTSKYTGFARALNIGENNNKYYELSGWLLGNGIYSISDKGVISLKIEVLAEYNNSAVKQLMGYINCRIQFKDNKLCLVPKKIAFAANKQYRVADPRIKATDKWSVEIKNSSANTSTGSSDIKWIENSFDIPNMQSTQGMAFDGMKSNINCVSKILFTQNDVTLTAMDGYTFSPQLANNGKFSVTISDSNKNNVDISYTCSTKTVDGKSTLIITFDRAYNKSELVNASIQFGL